jgi:hypothetical protein
MTRHPHLSAAALLAILLAPSLGVADDLCPDQKAQQAAGAQYAKAQRAEKDGKWSEAYAAASGLDTDCLRAPESEVKALRHRAALKLGQQAERKPDLERAFTWYQSADALPDADRVKLAQVRQQPEAQRAVADGLDWFKRRGDEAALRELRAIAGRNADKALAAEEKAFARLGNDSFEPLDLARTWLGHAGAGDQRVKERAEKRGDTLAADDTRQSLGLALRYYQVAGKVEKRKSVSEKARRLGEAHAKKGEASVAADFFDLAGDRARATTTRDEARAQEEKTEKKRQKGFQKDQSKLEKELGL